MKNMALALTLAVLASFARGQTSQPSQADLLAAESCRQSARALIYSPAGSSTRAGRLVALARQAQALNPSDPQTALMLEFLYASRLKYQLAADAAKTYLAGYPDDFAQSLQLLSLGLQAQGDSSENRLNFLDGIIQGKGAAPLRSEALTISAAILMGQGDKAKATAALDEALKIDPQNVAAIRSRFALREDPSPLERADYLTRLLAANPGDEQSAWQLAQLLNAQGSHERALQLYEFAEEFIKRRGDRDMQTTFATQYANAMLDAGQAAKAAPKLQSLCQAYPDVTDLRILQAEAWELAGDAEKSKEVGRDIMSYYHRKETAASPPPSLAIELAWFYTITMRVPESALQWARQAERTNSDSPILQRILGAAEMISGKRELIDKAIDRLRKIADKDPYAALFLAEYYGMSPISKPDAGKIILAAAPLSRSGPAYRKLQALAARLAVRIPPPDCSELNKIVDAFTPELRELAKAPDKSLLVSVEPISPVIVPGEPLLVKATLANQGKLPVPLGENGMCNPVLGFKVSAPDYAQAVFNDLPLAIWPTPRALAPGQSLTCQVRLDVAALEAFLEAHVLDDLTLQVDCTLSPVQQGDQMRPWLASIKVEPLKIVRAGLMGQFDRQKKEAWAPAYQLMLGYLVRDMKRGDLPRRMRAASQTGMLLAMARNVELGKVDPPEMLRGVLTRPVLMRMMTEVLSDATPAVRAEMLNAMNDTALDDTLLQLLSPYVGDVSPLVRFRMAELIGRSGTPGAETLIQMFLRDGDELVRAMASAFRKIGAAKTQ